MQLYTYWRSSAAYRVRIALALKGLPYDSVPVHLVRGGGEQFADDYRALNPQQLVPTLVLDDGTALTQSLAIMEYLDEAHPEPPLLPAAAKERAHVRALAQAVACEVHPVNNLRVLSYLTGTLGVDEEAKTAWYGHWIERGFTAFEALLDSRDVTGPYCHGDTPTLADACLIPQVYNARRFAVDLAPYPTIRRIEEAFLKLDSFDAARPETQPDAVG